MDSIIDINKAYLDYLEDMHGCNERDPQEEQETQEAPKPASPLDGCEEVFCVCGSPVVEAFAKIIRGEFVEMWGRVGFGKPFPLSLEDPDTQELISFVKGKRKEATMNILNNIKFSCRMASKQEGLFTPAHCKYIVTLTHNGVRRSFEYQCNPNYTTPEKKDVIECLLSDMDAYEDTEDVASFLYEFGYTENEKAIREGMEAYKGCEKNARKFYDLFSDSEIIRIREVCREW